jgi:cobalamin synthase
MTFDLPWHPVMVHVPLGLGVVVPVVAVGVLLAARRRGGLDRRDWWPVVLLQAVVLAGALVALRTGEAEEERVEDVVGKEAIHHHEERAEAFTWLTGLSLAAGATAWAVSAPRRFTLAVVATIAATAAAGATFWVGHSGGELVYRHGAARAYVPEPPDAAAAH